MIKFCLVMLLMTNGLQSNAQIKSVAQNRKPAFVAEGQPVFPYGGVYFRKSNPPKEDWDNDYKIASELGVNVFRHWFMWASVEIEPGKYDWEDYDRQMDLASKYGIKVIIGEISNGAPEWMYDKYPNARTVDMNGSAHSPSMGASAVTSDAGLCLDNEEILLGAEKFQTALIERYRDHPALLGYDLWNEMHANECYCKATQEKFRDWLKKKYGTIEALGKAWHRYSIGSWENLHPPQ